MSLITDTAMACLQRWQGCEKADSPCKELKVRSALHFRYSIVIPCFILRANTA